jgi:hypothetical protein
MLEWLTTRIRPTAEVVIDSSIALGHWSDVGTSGLTGDLVGRRRNVGDVAGTSGSDG